MMLRPKVRNLEVCLSAFLWMAEKRSDNTPEVIVFLPPSASQQHALRRRFLHRPRPDRRTAVTAVLNIGRANTAQSDANLATALDKLPPVTTGTGTGPAVPAA
jgi:hypothetical protein